MDKVGVTAEDCFAIARNDNLGFRNLILGGGKIQHLLFIWLVAYNKEEA